MSSSEKTVHNWLMYILSFGSICVAIFFWQGFFTFSILVVGLFVVIFEHFFPKKKTVNFFVIILTVLILLSGYIKSHSDVKEIKRLNQATMTNEMQIEKQNDALKNANVTLVALHENLEKNNAALSESERLLDKTRKTLNSTQLSLENVTRFSYVSRYGLYGSEYFFGPGLTSGSLLFDTLKESYYFENGLGYFRCFEPYEATYKKLINEYPDFPFSYFALANCLHNRNDSQWKGYAVEAVKILSWTTKIGGHKREHDEALKILNGFLHEN